jgi:hypothetical protein
MIFYCVVFVGVIVVMVFGAENGGWMRLDTKAWCRFGKEAVCQWVKRV